ncbi:MAG TPA: alpha/beta fold hydrolase [Gaiellaceae bacterium]|jgi:pimeloyl-ACP methyl ester carboxylesterase
MAELATIARVRADYVNAEGARILVHRWGDGSGQRVLFWHGGGGGSGELPELAPFLAEAGYSVYAPDAPGYGGSPALDASRYRPSLLAELAAALIDGLGIAPVTWIGSSWGANVGIHTAALFPTRIRALALLDGGYMDVSDDPDYDPALGLDARTAELRTRVEQGESWDASPEVIALAMQAADREPCSALLPALSSTGVPVLLVRATQPPEYESIRARGVERFQANLPKAEVIALPGSGHHLLGEAPAEVERILLEWLPRNA